MSTFAVARCVLPSAVAVVLAGTIGVDAGAKSKSKGRRVVGEATVSEPVGATVGAATQAASAAPVRYFTINQVLAKRAGDGRATAATLSTVGLGNAAVGTPAGTLGTQRSTEPFGLITFRAPEGLLWVKWRRVQEQIRGEAKVLATCQAEVDCVSPGGKKLAAIIAEARKRDGRARISVVNRLVNVSIRYTSDFAQYGVADLWSPPIATLTSGRGDCEDYAIAKYVALHEAGIADADLRLVLVRDRSANQDHAVLTVRQHGRWLVLDNRHTVLNESTELVSFTPLFALDQGGVKLFAAPFVHLPSEEQSSGEAAVPASDESARDAATNDPPAREEDGWHLRGGTTM